MWVEVIVVAMPALAMKSMQEHNKAYTSPVLSRASFGMTNANVAAFMRGLVVHQVQCPHMGGGVGFAE